MKQKKKKKIKTKREMMEKKKMIAIDMLIMRNAMRIEMIMITIKI